MFGRGADKWLDAPLGVFFPYVAFVLVGTFHFARLVVRGAEAYGQENGREDGLRDGLAWGDRRGRAVQYLEQAEMNGWGLSDEVFAELLHIQRAGHWTPAHDARWPGLLDDPLDCSYFITRHNPNKRAPEPADVDGVEQGQAGEYDRVARRARRALQLGDDPYAEYRGTVLRDPAAADDAELVDAELVDEGQAEESTRV